jgi:hypothetical protein
VNLITAGGGAVSTSDDRPFAGRRPLTGSVPGTWLELKRRDGTIDALYRYWILGQNFTNHTPRWSIMRACCTGWSDAPGALPLPEFFSGTLAEFALAQDCPPA